MSKRLNLPNLWLLPNESQLLSVAFSVMVFLFRGVHPPEAMTHFPRFRISTYFRKIFKFHGTFSQSVSFPQFVFGFHPPKFLMTFFRVIDSKLEFPPYFR